MLAQRAQLTAAQYHAMRFKIWMHQVIELNGKVASDRRQPIFDALGGIVVYRDLPEIHRFGETIYAQAEMDSVDHDVEGVAAIFRTAAVPNLVALSSFYHAFRSLRDAHKSSNAVDKDRIECLGK